MEVYEQLRKQAESDLKLKKAQSTSIAVEPKAACPPSSNASSSVAAKAIPAQRRGRANLTAPASGLRKDDAATDDAARSSLRRSILGIGVARRLSGGRAPRASSSHILEHGIKDDKKSFMEQYLHDRKDGTSRELAVQHASSQIRLSLNESDEKGGGLFEDSPAPTSHRSQRIER